MKCQAKSTCMSPRPHTFWSWPILSHAEAWKGKRNAQDVRNALCYHPCIKGACDTPAHDAGALPAMGRGKAPLIHGVLEVPWPV